MPKRNVAKSGFLIFALLFIVVLSSAFFETTTGLNQKGTKSFQEKRYESALDAYQKAQIRKPDHPTIRYNLGTTLYELDQFQEAQTQLQKALERADTKELKAAAWYNYGNVEYRLGQFDKAIEAYRQTLDLNPNDQDAKFNLELLQKKKRLFEDKQKKRDQEKKQKPPQSQQQNQKQQSGGGGSSQKQQPSQGKEERKPAQGQQSGQEQEEKGNEEEQKSPKDQKKEDPSKTPEPGEGEEKSQDKKDQGDQQEQQPVRPSEEQGGEEEQKQQQQASEGTEEKPLYQGQMPKENALRILNALKESEQELQFLRRPRKQAEHEPLKDW